MAMEEKRAMLSLKSTGSKRGMLNAGRSKTRGSEVQSVKGAEEDAGAGPVMDGVVFLTSLIGLALCVAFVLV